MAVYPVWYHAPVPAPHPIADSPEQVGVDPARLEALFERAGREVREGLLPSCQIAVARRGRLAGMRSFGRVTCEGRPRPASNDTLYVVSSCSKAVTSAAAWLLVQEGKLDLEERVCDVVPEITGNRIEAERVEQLFTHTAGFPHAPHPQREWHDHERRLERFRTWRLNWEPGTRYEYHATSSMWVIAEIVERRGGIPFREFVRERVARPLGLDDLHMGLPSALHGRLADIVHVGEEVTPEELRALGLPEIPENEVTEEAIQGFNEAPVREAGCPGGGVVATAGDLALFYQGLLTGRSPDGEEVWREETLRSALRIRSGDLRDPWLGCRANRALGVVIAGDDERHLRGFGRTGSPFLFGHGGAGGQLAWADPETGISLGYVTNGFDRHRLRQARRGVGISSRAATCALVD